MYTETLPIHNHEGQTPVDNPSSYLKAFVKAHHPSVVMSPVYSQGREALVYGWGHTTLKSERWDFRLMLPRNAPESARPLCTTIKRGNKIVWEFVSDHKLFHGLRQKFRVHLHEFRQQDIKQFMLIEVLEGNPDQITRVYRIDGTEFRHDLECLLKVQVARQWGIRAYLEKSEKDALSRLMQPSK